MNGDREEALREARACAGLRRVTGSGGIRYSAGTHVGHVRSVNEDSLISLPDQGLWVVSDGMGGHAAGDFASQTVTEAMAVLPNPLPPTALMHGVRNALHRAWGPWSPGLCVPMR